MATSDHARIVISASQVTAQRAGFGQLGLISHAAPFPERGRFYQSQIGLLEDFPAESPEARWSASAFAQSPAPEGVWILRSSLLVEQQYEIDIALPSDTIQVRASADAGGTFTNLDSVFEIREPGTIGNGLELTLVAGAALGLTEDAAETTVTFVDAVTTVLEVEELIDASSELWRVRTPGTPADTLADTDDEGTLTAAGGVDGIPAPVYSLGAVGSGFVADGFGGDLIEYTWQPADTATSVAAALAALLDEVPGANYTSTPTGAQIVVDLDTPNAWAGIFADPLISDLIGIRQSHDAPTGLADDLADILAEVGGWYWLSSIYNSAGYIAAVSAWAASAASDEALFEYVALSQDTDDLLASTGSEGPFDSLADLALFRVNPLWSHRPDQFFDGGISGVLAPKVVGRWTQKFKRPTGISVPALTATKKANLLARHANFLESNRGIVILREGTTSLGPQAIRGFLDEVVGLDWVSDDMQAGVYEVLASADKIARTDRGITAIESAVRATLLRAVERGIAAADPAFTVTVPAIATQNDLLPRGVRILFEFTMAGAVHKVDVFGNVVRAVVSGEVTL
jgi:hypothetical protein